MKNINYNNKIKSYLVYNPTLNHEKIENLLTIDSIYTETPEGIKSFREIYAHLDPYIIYNSHEGIIFLKITQSNKSEEYLKRELNDYINIKFNDIEYLKSYEYNMTFFKKYSRFASEVIREILETAAFRKDLISVLSEKEEVKNCHDLFQMLEIYRSSPSDRIKFEILRKLGLIVLIARINRSININYLDYEMKKVIKAFGKGLGFNNAKRGQCCLWLNYKDKVNFEKDEAKARLLYQQEVKKRQKLAMNIYPLQTLRYYTFETNSGNKIINLECRNKFKKGKTTSYASFIEKMIRKNLEFPNQIHDVIGLKIILRSEKDIRKIVHDLEKFLGGSSTRKREKNTYHKFNKSILNEYSSKDYYIWKAIYDITLTHPSIEQVKKMIKIAKENKIAQLELEQRLKYFLENPQDFVIEVQLQDIESYLLSVTRGSPTDHKLLKMSQIRNNSFHKFFPQEIYEKELSDLKFQILNNKCF